MGLEVIRTVMQRQGVTSDMLSNMSGVPKSTIDKIASGATDNPRYKSLQRLVDALGMTLDDFIRLVENRERSTDEDILISAFHSMNADGRVRALQLMQDMADSGHYPIRILQDYENESTEEE